MPIDFNQKKVKTGKMIMKLEEEKISSSPKESSNKA